MNKKWFFVLIGVVLSLGLTVGCASDGGGDPILDQPASGTPEPAPSTDAPVEGDAPADAEAPATP